MNFRHERQTDQNQHITFTFTVFHILHSLTQSLSFFSSLSIPIAHSYKTCYLCRFFFAIACKRHCRDACTYVCCLFEHAQIVIDAWKWFESNRLYTSKNGFGIIQCTIYTLHSYSYIYLSIYNNIKGIGIYIHVFEACPRERKKEKRNTFSNKRKSMRLSALLIHMKCLNCTAKELTRFFEYWYSYTIYTNTKIVKKILKIDKYVLKCKIFS